MKRMVSFDLLKKLLGCFLTAVLMLTCLTACDTFDSIFGGKSGVSKEYYENCAVFTFYDFESRICITLDRTGLGEGTIYYQVNLEEGALSVKYLDVGLINENQLLSEFAADDEMPINGSGGYIEGDKIAITFEAFSSVKGEIIIAFTEDALKAVHKELQLHEHSFTYTSAGKVGHYAASTCGCPSEEGTTPHYQNANARSIVSMTIGDSWKSVVSQKFTWSLDYDGVHYGDYAEWYSSFRILTNNYRYYLIAHETYVAPNNDNTDDFRTSKLIYKFNPNSDQIQLRDYQPKSKNPEMTISYGSDLSAEIGSDYSAKVSAGVSSSYSTILQSPKVYDKGNMANDEVNIEFEYVDPWTESDPWYSYNINQSMQTSIYVIRENRSNTALVDMSDIRTIQMVRDHFWPWYDKTVNFNYNITYTI